MPPQALADLLVRPGGRSAEIGANESRAGVPASRYFEANQGQTDPSVQFLSRGGKYVWFFGNDGATVSLESGAGQSAAVRMELVGANPRTVAVGLEPLPGRSNYFVGNDPEKWRSGIPHYGRLRYEDVYPGIDLVYYGTADGRLEYDFIVQPGVAPELIKLRLEGPERLEINEAGDLVLSLGGAQLFHRKPTIYQEVDGERRLVAGSYRIGDEGEVSFEIEEYETTQPLVVDPVFEYSTFVGGTDRDRESNMTADADGNLYMTAGVRSGDFPTTMGVFDETNNSAGAETSTAVFKLSADASALLFSTFLAGSVQDVPRSHGQKILVGSSGNIFVAGHSNSPDFPTTAGAFDETHNGEFDLYLSILNPTGSTLLYSTYIGGAERDQRPGIALDGEETVYLVGMSSSPGMPTTAGAFDATHNGGIDIYIARLSPQGNGAADLLYATFLGGQGDDNGPSMTIDDSGIIHAVGETESTDFPTTPGAFDTTHNGGGGSIDAGDDLFVIKFDANPAGDGSEDLLYSTFFGGSHEDDYDAFAPGIAVTEEGHILFTGETVSRRTDAIPFPLTQDAIDRVANPTVDGTRPDKVIIARIRPLGFGPSDLIYSSYWGGFGDNEQGALAYDQNGFIYLTGDTDAADFRTLDPLQAANAGGEADGFLSIFDQGGRRLLFSTYLGGSGQERHVSALPHPTGVFVTGQTDSTDFTTTPGVFDRTQNGGLDLFVSKITDLEFLPKPIGNVITVSAASFESPVAADSIGTAFGQGLARGMASATSSPLPTVLGGTSLQIIDSAGQEWLGGLVFTIETQLNFYIPAGLAPGEATVNVLLDGEIVATGTVEIRPVAPGVFFVGQRTAAAFFLRVNADSSREQRVVFTATLAPAAIDLGSEGTQVFLLLFGTGIRAFGQSVTATVGGVPVPVLGAVPHGVFVGLDQINIGPIPRSLIGRGDVEVVITVDGIPSNPVIVQFL